MSATPLSARAWFDERATPDLGVGGASLVRMHSIYEARGHLTVGEMGRGMPFVPRRFFVISDVPDEGIRGEHAHRALDQLLVCLAGSVVAEVSDGATQRCVLLDVPHVGLHIPPMVWGVQHHYTRDAVLMVLASAEYDAADYIRDFSEFKALRARRPVKVPFLSLKPIHDEMGPALEEACRRVMRSGWYILGPEVEAFEERFASYCGTKHCVGVGNGLDAMMLVLRAWGVGEGHEVIVPSNTYIATWLAVSYSGARPVPVEPDEATCNIDPDRIERAITRRTRAILPVHLYGQPADMAPIREIGKRRGIPVLEDAAQAHGARYRGKRAGALGDAAAFSFYPTKNLGAFGDAGAVTTDDDKLAGKVRALRNYGSRKRYVNEVKGFNSRLDPLQAALLAARLAKLDEWNARRSRIAKRYLVSFESTPLVLPMTGAGCVHAWHLFVVRSKRRKALREALEARGVGTDIHYPTPPHLQRAYADLRLRKGAFPISERIHRQVVSLPIGPHMSDAEVDYVIAQVLAAA